MNTTKKLLAFLLTLCLFVCMSVPAFAVSAKSGTFADYGTTKSFLKVMDEADRLYTYVGVTSDDEEQVKTSYVGENMDSIDLNLYFTQNLKAVHMTSWRVISFSSSDLAKVLKLVNELNRNYYYAKFVVDTDDLSVDAELDLRLRDDEHAGEITYDGVNLLVSIIDEAYPELEMYAK